MSWKQLDSKLLNYHHDCIGVLTVNGFQYFIAAFLLEDIENDSPIAEKLVWDFSQAILDNSSPIVGVSGLRCRSYTDPESTALHRVS